MEPNELKYWVAFARIPQIGRVRIKRLEEHFGALQNAWGAGLTELRTAGLDNRTANLVATRKLVIDPDAELAGLAEQGVRALTWHNDEYPSRLKGDIRPAAGPVRPGGAQAGGRAVGGGGRYP